MQRIARNTGFDGRMFLIATEWQTYCRRKPVRYIRKMKEDVCHVCGASSAKDNPFQNAHIVGFDMGVIELALTPDWLDSDANIVTTHRTACNKATELDLHGAMTHLHSIGVEELPDFLPDHIHAMWRTVTE